MRILSAPCAYAPSQNDLDEFFALIDFTVPGALGDRKTFDKEFGKPIFRARDLEATEREMQLGRKASAHFTKLVGQIMLRRTNEVIAKYLPAKLDVNVFCTLTEEQQTLYMAKVAEGSTLYQQSDKSKKRSSAFRTVTILKKIVNDPHTAVANEQAAQCQSLAGGTVAAAGRSRAPVDAKISLELSGKLQVMSQLLLAVRRSSEHSDERFVLISNYTTTLDAFAALLRHHNLTYRRLDGQIEAKKRQEMVDSFNADGTIFAFLLSSKAGGCGINLIGANRLILFDPDWNPATDAQALARVWRSGQEKPCYVYRFFAVGSLEEVCYERQCSKEGLAKEMVDGDGDGRKFSEDELRSLFSPKFESRSNFHERQKCRCCAGGAREPDSNGFMHMLPGSDELRVADAALAQAAALSGRVTLAYTRVTDATGRGFAR
jgi:DNA repair and recombination RAD54-like protein